MKKFMIAVVTGLFLMSVGSVSFAEGLMDKLKGKADDTKAEASKKIETKTAESEKAIETKSATKEEAGDMMGDAKKTVKDAVNEKIDGLGK